MNLSDSITSASGVVLRCLCIALRIHREFQDHRPSRLHHFVSGVIISQVFCFFTGVLGQAEPQLQLRTCFPCSSNFLIFCFLDPLIVVILRCLGYHLGQNNYSFDALQAYCFGINIKL